MPAIDHMQYQAVFDFPIIEYYKKLGFDFTHESFDQIAVEFVELYYPRVAECTLQAHASETIDWLYNSRIGQSVLSATHQAALEAVLDTFDLTEKFEYILGLDDHHARSKLDAGRELMRNLGLASDQVLLVGDTVHDCEVAHEIGIECILVPGGHHTLEKLTRTGAPVVQTLRDLTLNG
jgi:phosphoglycolate phosphatase